MKFVHRTFPRAIQTFISWGMYLLDEPDKLDIFVQEFICDLSQYTVSGLQGARDHIRQIRNKIEINKYDHCSYSVHDNLKQHQHSKIKLSGLRVHQHIKDHNGGLELQANQK